MPNLAWRDDQAWANLARNLQQTTNRWSLAGLVCIVLAALCGAATTVFPETSGATKIATTVTLGSPAAPDSVSSAATIAAAFAGTAALASAIRAIPGRQMPGSGAEGAWILARATAEAIKSECFRFAARAGASAGVDGLAAAEADLVTATEDLLESEYKAWLPQMLATERQPPAPPKAPGQEQPGS